jgi:hypothetical protein
MKTKDQIVSEIRRLAMLNDGHVSLRNFIATTGIPEKQILGKHWATWNEALVEAGVATSSFFQPKTDEALILAAFAELIERLKKWPTESQLRLERQSNPSFPSLGVIDRFKKETSLPQKLVEYCETNDKLLTAARIARDRMETEAASSNVVGRANVVGYVYMMKSGRRYKIGHTKTPSRRHREVRLDLPDPTTLVHTIQTDDPVGIESYWHNRFSSKRVRDTEFFTLDASEVAAFKRRKYQ